MTAPPRVSRKFRHFGMDRTPMTVTRIYCHGEQVDAYRIPLSGRGLTVRCGRCRRVVRFGAR